MVRFFTRGTVAPRVTFSLERPIPTLPIGFQAAPGTLPSVSTIRTDDDRISAVESMFRIRAVESPPDPAGLRTIWHRGLKGAELVSEVDASGRVLRQEFALFDDVVVWAEGKTRTGESTGSGTKRPRPSEGLTFDERPLDDRLDRVGRALKQYRGADRFIQHFRDVLGVSDDQAPPLVDNPITRTANVVRRDQALDEAARREALRAAERRRSLGLVAIGAGLVLVLVGLAFLWVWSG